MTGKRVLIIGNGREGKSTFRYLQSHVPGIHVDVTDQSDGPEYLKNQSQYDIVIKSPGVSKTKLNVPYTTPANLFFENISGTTVGVTGTKGKSTTTCLIYEIVKRVKNRVHLVGNVGKPWLDELADDSGPDDIYICEFSSYQLDDIRHSPHISVFVSFFPEHMDYHGSIELYWEAKSSIVRYAGQQDYFIYNPRFPRLTELARGTKARVIPYADTIPFEVENPLIRGEHNRDNIKAAVAVAEIFRIDMNTVKQAVDSFTPLPHRLQYVKTVAGVQYYDDAISTTPESTICALDALNPVSVLMLGGTDRGYDFRNLVRIIHEKNIRNLVLFPDSGLVIEKLLRDYPEDTYTICKTRDMEAAVRFAYQSAPKGTICLLSTASPSYSIWKNFEEKGSLFQTYVRNLV